ncbi:hypothetical protein NBRC110019_07560 [Neptunitalea chrysea]|uniref:DUF935 family protein n=1 Tax=Neptunitalea chrysea TaxID=1647581 RepID=A0A9W6B5J5_9FLAO|nr:hypothetical protein [Neptunitalea chrysea]GLB51717.1 hypothetical protein NBRC110019_07560 [Neptunitalea chrysea]
MWIPKTIHNAIVRYTFKNTSEAALRVMAETKSGSKKALSDKYNKEAITMGVKTLEDWKMGLLLASDPDSPSWYQLQQVYDNMKLDLHLMATIDNRVEPVQATPFKFTDKDGNEVEEVKELFENMWFIDWIGIALRSKFEGVKVIEMFDLDDNLELKEVTEIDMGNVIPQKGIVTEDAGGESGWNYKEGILANNYMQIGGDNYLGMFAQLTPIVLAKKLGLGSWLDYIDKFGVPAVFAITDREDQTRLDELFEALSNFKSNNFMVGRGNENFQTMESGKTDAYNTFDKLIDRANSELSKRILGGTGITDEKSFVGAATVQEKGLQAKIKLDKFFIRVLINKELIPRLVKLSPVYKPLENLKFEWDDAESLSIKEYIEAIKDLSQFYEFDLEEVSQLLGMTITAVKNQLNTDPQDGEKKKA